MEKTSIVKNNDSVLVTGAAGFIGSRVVENLIKRGFKHVRCMVRPTSNLKRIRSIAECLQADANLEIITGNLLSREDCKKAIEKVKIVYHLAAGTGTKSFADAYLNSVVTTRNLIEVSLENRYLARLVNLSSFAVYSNIGNPRRGILDEDSPVEPHPESRAEAYCYAKVKQDELVEAYGRSHDLPYVLLRPGVVYGPGKNAITGRVGIDTFGFFMHLGGGNPIPFTYVDNCADAVVLAGIVPGINREVFNLLDNDIPTSRQFLMAYKENVKDFPSLYIPPLLSYLFCCLWEGYTKWSKNQLPPVFTRAEWHAYWKKTRYDNNKLNTKLGWTQKVSTKDGMLQFFEGCREGKQNA